MLATANALKESLGEYLTDGLVILWLKPTSPNEVFQPEKRMRTIRTRDFLSVGFQPSVLHTRFTQTSCTSVYSKALNTGKRPKISSVVSMASSCIIPMQMTNH